MGYGDDYFGRYAWVPTGVKNNLHMYKVVGALRTNRYSETPLTPATIHNPYNHGDVADVFNVIHCGIDESEVVRVAMKDCELVGIENPPWEWLINHVDADVAKALFEAKDEWEARHGDVD